MPEVRPNKPWDEKDEYGAGILSTLRRFRNTAKVTVGVAGQGLEEFWTKDADLAHAPLLT